MTAAMPSYGKIKSNAADSASNRNAKPTAQAREKGGRVLTHPTEDTNVPLPPLADDLTVSLSSRQSRLSSSGRQRVDTNTNVNTSTTRLTRLELRRSFLDSRKGFYILEDSGTYLHSRTADTVVP